MTDDLSSSRLDQMAHRTLNQVRKLQAKSLGYLLIRCSQMWGDRAIAAVNREAGGPVLREAHTRLLPYLQTAEGIRITDLAKAVDVTKQAVQPLVSELAMVGIVRIETDQQDARARRVFLTDFGIEALLHGTGILLRIEAEVLPRLGKSAAAELKKHLAALLALLQDTAHDTKVTTAPAKRPA